MRVLVLGAQGQVGRALLATAPPDFEIIGLGRDKCDLTSNCSVESAIEASEAAIVINAAAATAVDALENDAPLAERINGECPGILAAAARRAGARLVHLSTDFVFDGTASTPRRPDDPVNPLSVYGRSKLSGERAVAIHAPDALIVRTAWVYSEAGSNFVLTMLQLMAEREKLSVVDDQIGTPTYATSLAGALWRLIAARATGIYHFTDAGVCSWYDFAVEIGLEATALGLLQRPCPIAPIPSSSYPTPAPRPAYSVLDKSATWDLLGEPSPHWRANLRQCLANIQPTHARRGKDN